MHSISIILVQEGMKHLDGDNFSRIFYKKLFELYPDVKSLFKDDNEKQQKLLYQMINFLVINADSGDVIQTLQELAHRHIKYGVKKEH